MLNESSDNPLSQESSKPEQNNVGTSEATENASVNESAKFDEMQKRLDGQSATISRMERMLKGIAESKSHEVQKPSESKGKNDDFETAKAELMAMKADIEAKANMTRDKQKKHLMVSELQAKGLTAIAADEAYISISAREGDKIQLSDDESSVIYQRGEFDDPTPISNFVDTFLTSDRGRLYAPVKSNPNSGSRATGTDASGSKYITRDQLSTLSTEELKSGQYVLKD